VRPSVGLGLGLSMGGRVLCLRASVAFVCLVSVFRLFLLGWGNFLDSVSALPFLRGWPPIPDPISRPCPGSPKSRSSAYGAGEVQIFNSFGVQKYKNFFLLVPKNTRIFLVLLASKDTRVFWEVSLQRFSTACV
jgi:hypothetical protein